VDHDGYEPGVDFTDLAVTDTANFVSVSDPSVAILRNNFVLGSFLNPLRSGLSNPVGFRVDIPAGTPAGRYRGRIQVSDTIKGQGVNANRQVLRVDGFEIEVEVLPERGVGLVQGDTAARLDSLVIRGRPGERAS